MPSPRRFKGIKQVRISTDASSWTTLTGLSATQSGVVYEPHGDDVPKTIYGNNYSGPERRQYQFSWTDRNQFDTYRAGHLAKTAYYFEFTLDNDETHTTDNALQFEELRPVDNDGGLVQGRSDEFLASVRAIADIITEATS